MPEPPKTRRNLAGDAVSGEIQVAEKRDFRETIRDGTRKIVLGKVEVLKTLAVGDISRKRGVYGVVVERDIREERKATPLTVCLRVLTLQLSTTKLDDYRGFSFQSQLLHISLCLLCFFNTRAIYQEASIMYGGDEVSAIVIDLGSHTCKAGYAGEDAPKAVFPSVVGSIDQMEVDDPANAEKNSGSAGESKNNSNNSKTLDSDKAKGRRKLYVGSQALGFRRDHMEVLSPLKDGVVADWDLVDSIWDHAFRECLLIDPKEHPMLLAEPSSNTQQQRERTAELMFEKYKVPALFLAKNAVLTSFASGRATSLVVDSGGGSTTVAPVHDGYVLQKAVASSPIGGDFLTDCLTKSLESKGITIKPRYSFKRKEIRPGEFQTVDLDFPNTTESYKLYSQRVIANDIKECVCRAPDTPYDESAYSNIPMTPYELPDGQTIEIGADRFKIPDILFNPPLAQTIPGTESFAEIASSVRGLPQMVIESINKCDVDIRRELFSSILLAGGTASMQQLKERLEKDLLEESPQAARVKVLASGNATERRFSVWIGGSILASLGSFQQMWFSKSEYEEHGASYIQRKCP